MSHHSSKDYFIGLSRPGCIAECFLNVKLLELQKLVAMTGVVMTFRYQAFMIRRQTFCKVGVALGRLFQASSLGLPLYVT